MENVPQNRLKLGKREPKRDHRTFKLAKYLATALPPVRTSVNYYTKIQSWPMMANDTLGDCTCAAAGHMIQQWSTYANEKPTVPTDQQVIAAYSAITGYVPGEPWTDNGAYMLDVLKYWRNSGIGGHKLTAFAAVSVPNLDEMKWSLALFGNLYIGLQLPLSAATQKVWAVDNSNPANAAPGSWGGHCVPVVSFGPHFMTVVTWGQYLHMHYDFYLQYADEAYAAVSKDWISNQAGGTPSCFNFDQLLLDLQQL